jgi:phosphonopyruvate decarboxylase
MIEMIDTEEFLSFLSDQGFSLASGVPCSYFKDTFTALEKFNKITYVPATREDEAVGIVCGYFFGGKNGFLILQNSGLATIGDALTSLAQLYKIPLLMFVSYRGLEPDADFPEHLIMGDITEDVLEAYQIPYWIIKEENWKTFLGQAIKVMRVSSSPVCILVKKGSLSQ